MKKQGFFSRFVYPLALVVGLWAVASYTYNNAGPMEPGVLKNVLVGVSGPVLFFSIWFIGLIAVPLAYFRGASFIERFIIAIVNPVSWIIRVEMQVACQYTTVELFYFFLLPWIFGCLCLALFEFGAADFICRFIHKIRYPGPVRVFHPLVILFLLGGLGGTYIALIKGQEWVYLVVHHYAANVLR